MIKKLRFKFIIITMISIIFVLSILITAVNIANFNSVNQYSDQILYVLQEHDGAFTGVNFDDDEEVANSEKDKTYEYLNRETPYETRFFVVTYDQNNEFVKVNTKNVAAVDIYKAVGLAQQAKDSAREKGSIGDYRFLIDDEKNIVIFVDCKKQITTARMFLKASIFISIIGALIVFILIYFLSIPIVRNYAAYYEKQKRFITDAGHELKTPLTIISANNELEEMENGESGYTEAINKQVFRMTNMVKNLTELAKLDEKEQLKGISSFSLSDTASDITNNYKNVFESNHKQLFIDIEENIALTGDEGLIRKLLTVILDNAVKYSTSKALFLLKRSNRDIVLTLSNDANNLPEGDLDVLFERFYRSDESRASSIEGSGIGLSIAKEIVLLHKGKISASRTEKGNFTIKIIF